MEKKESFEKICKNKLFLLETLSVDANFILQLVQEEKLITHRDYQNLSDNTQREKTIIELLDKLMGRGESTCQNFLGLLRQERVLECFPKLKDHAILRSSSTEITYYKMTQNPRGVCVIINNVHFTNKEERRGSDKDQHFLAKVFRWLGFTVEEHRNKSAADMKILLKAMGSRVDGDCFVCCVLSHGTKAGVFGTDGAIVSVDEIREPFTGIKCPVLVEKPKLFFIQACRGNRSQSRVKLQSDAEKNEESEMEMEVDADAFDVTIPSDTDFLIARSTIDDHVSYRKPEEGSWFIQSLCRNLKEHCPLGEDLQSILLRVNDDVGKLGINCKQTPVHEVAMRKKLILRPIHQ